MSAKTRRKAEEVEISTGSRNIQKEVSRNFYGMITCDMTTSTARMEACDGLSPTGDPHSRDGSTASIDRLAPEFGVVWIWCSTPSERYEAGTVSSGAKRKEETVPAGVTPLRQSSKEEISIVRNGNKCKISGDLRRQMRVRLGVVCLFLKKEGGGRTNG